VELLLLNSMFLNYFPKLLPPGGYPIAVKYIISYIISSMAASLYRHVASLAHVPHIRGYHAK